MWLVGRPANVSTLNSTRLSVLIQNSQEEDAKCCFRLTYTVGQVGTQTHPLYNKAIQSKRLYRILLYI